MDALPRSRPADEPMSVSSGGEVLVGVDIGTNSSKGVACRPDGTVLAEARAEHSVSLPRPGWVEHDADAVWWHDFCVIARQLMAALPPGSHVAAVSVSACGPCLLPVDRNGRPLRPGILYRVDTRASDQIKVLLDRYGSDDLLRLGGSKLTSQSVGPKIIWLRDNEPDVWSKTAHYLTATGYVVFRLTNEYVIDHHHSSYFGPFIDIRHGRWDLRYADGAVTEEQLPRIRWSNETVGTVTERAADECGLPEGTLVTAGSTDGLMEAVAAGLLGQGTLVINYASVMNLFVTTPRIAATRHLWLSEGLVPGEYVMAGGVATGGSLTSWFRKQFAREWPQETTSDVTLAHGALAAEAETSPPGSNGLLMLPYFNGEDTPFYDPDARGVIAGLSLGTTRGDVYRAIMESTALGIRHNLVEIRRSGVRIDRVRALGGGAITRLWPQIVSDMTGLKQEVPARTAGSAFSDAFLAGLATGLVAKDDLETNWIHIARLVEPDPTVGELYDRLYTMYGRFYKSTRTLVHELAAEAKRKVEDALSTPTQGSIATRRVSLTPSASPERFGSQARMTRKQEC